MALITFWIRADSAQLVLVQEPFPAPPRPWIRMISLAKFTEICLLLVDEETGLWVWGVLGGIAGMAILGSTCTFVIN